MSSSYYTDEDIEYDMINFMEKEFMGIRMKLWILLIIVVVCINYSKNHADKNRSSNANASDNPVDPNGKPGYYGYY